MNDTADQDWLESLYRRYHHRRYVEPDPLQFVLRFDRPDDQEVAGLIASSLAYGNVKTILASVERVLTALGPHPAAFLRDTPPRHLRGRLAGFKHRFTSDRQLVGMLLGARDQIRKCGSLHACFTRHDRAKDETLLAALGRFVDAIAAGAGVSLEHLLPHPARGSACKRLHLFLRWMVRRDRIDPGPWEGVDPSKLIVPLDTHVHRIALARRWTKRKSADGRTALEVTERLRRLRPADPLRWDFAMTRPGIRNEPEVG
ncbi:MAG: TIGR02757 family protein [Phycisphaerales bacterium]|nr:MAG: TIGR02757 family protein [Phycisphaerales bacterium]